MILQFMNKLHLVINEITVVYEIECCYSMKIYL
jgi:hypothetical protein